MPFNNDIISFASPSGASAVPTATATASTTTLQRAFLVTSSLVLQSADTMDNNMGSVQATIDALVKDALRPAGLCLKPLGPVGRNGIFADGLPPLLRYPTEFVVPNSPIEKWKSERPNAVDDMLEYLVTGRLLLACTPTPKNEEGHKELEEMEDPDHHFVMPHIDLNDVFSTQHASTLRRSHRIEELWRSHRSSQLFSSHNNEKTSVQDVLTRLETAFWDACYERMHRPRECVLRKAYLRLETAVEVKGRMVLSRKPPSYVMEIMCDELVKRITSQDAVEARMGYNLEGLIFAIGNSEGEGECVKFAKDVEDEEDELARLLSDALELDAMEEKAKTEAERKLEESHKPEPRVDGMMD